MSDVTARLSLPYLAAAQAQKHVTLNEALTLLDVLVQAAVVSRATTAQPGAPAEGQAWILPVSATGADWSGFPTGSVAAWRDGAWLALAPAAGWRAWVTDEAALVVFDGSAWRSAAPSVQQLAELGIGAAPQAGTPLLAELNAALFTSRPAARGGDGDLRLKLNKDAGGAVASILWQLGYSGRAEFGLVGDAEPALKVSADGSSWREALRARADGAITAPGGIASVAGGPTAGLRNLLHNGGFEVLQRGAGPAGDGVLADRWRMTGYGGLVAAQSTVTESASGRGAPALSVTQPAPGAGQSLIVRQSVEEFERLRGAKVTLSGWAKGPAGATSLHGVDDQVVTLTHTGDWLRFSVTAELAADLTAVWVDALRSPSAAGVYLLSEVQLEQGPIATPFEPRPRALELTLCRRYFRRYATAKSPADLAYAMRAAPTQSGTGPYDYSAEL